MITIFMFYSRDRLSQLEICLSFLQKMDGYDDCQKILLADEQSNIHPPGWELALVPRRRGKYVWAWAWETGIHLARYPGVLYLDSDRILPKHYLSLIKNSLKKNTFLFNHRHYKIKEHISIETIKKIQDNPIEYSKFIERDFRHKLPLSGPGKNVMSGCTAFLIEDYYRSGGVDPWYEGGGAYADTDFHFQTYMKKFSFIDTGVMELHLNHQAGGDPYQCLANMYYYCLKWGLSLEIPLQRAIELEVSLDMIKDLYIDKSPITKDDRSPPQIYICENQQTSQVNG